MTISEVITFIALFGFTVVVLPMIFIVIDDWRKGL